MKLPKLFFALCLLPSFLSAQEYGLEVVTVSEDIGVLAGLGGAEIDMTGYSTYRAYITMVNETDILSSISGDSANPTLVTTTTDFFHHELGAGLPNAINSLLFSVYPDLEYDSWVTIGISGTFNSSAGETAVLSVSSSDNPWLTNFDPGGGVPGGNIVIDDNIGGAWFATSDAANGVAGEDLRVLAGQFTTQGDLSMSLYVQIFIEGDGLNEYLVDGNRPTFVWPAVGIEGCTDETACNYDASSTIDDGSCTYPPDYYDCAGNCINDTDGDSICDEEETVGCTDPDACNYVPNATDDDGSCESTSCLGCTESGACNYDEGATQDDGSCEYASCAGCTDDMACNFDASATLDDMSCDYTCIGCLDPMACNYDSTATVSGDCTYPQFDYVDCDGACLNDEDGDGLCDEEEGCGDPEACNYDAGAVVEQADYCLIVDTVAVHSATSNLAGMTTYRYYVKCANPADFVSSISGDSTNPTVVTTTTDFYQDDLGGVTPSGISTPLFGTYPELQYDSWVTIGYSSVPDGVAGEAPIATVASNDNPWQLNFEPQVGNTGGNIVINDNVGGAWFAVNGDANGIAANSANNQVLIAQLTTSGDVEGNFYVQIFPNGDGSVESALYFNFNIGDACLAPDDDCQYPSDLYGVDYLDCDANCLNDSDMDGVCDEDEVPGCTDMTALNFDPLATDDDNEACQYPATSVYEIIESSESHTILEDLILLAGLDSTLTYDGAWTVFAPTDAAVNAVGSVVVDYLLSDPVTLMDVLLYHVAADSITSDLLMDNMTIPMLNEQDATITFVDGAYFINGAEIIIADLIADNGVVHVIDAVIVPSIAGCTELVSCNYNPLADTDDGSCESESCAGCLDAMACNYDSSWTINDLESCTYPEDLWGADYYDCFGNCLNDFNEDGICDEADVYGCTLEGACNYNPAATVDDGGCDITSCAGCTDSLACNFMVDATIDNGSCDFPVDLYGNPNVDCDNVCINDADGDGVCDEDEIAGCGDETACNYNGAATDPAECDFSCYGCTDSAAANYDPAATLDDGGCVFCALSINADVETVDVTCKDDMDGSILISGTTGEFGPVYYTLDGMSIQLSGEFTQLSGGTYEVIATDSLMCMDTIEVVIIEPAEFQVFAFANDVTCNGDEDGSIFATSQGGVDPVTFELADVSNSSGDFIDLDAGPYTVFATDGNGCEANINAEVGEPDAIVITVVDAVDPDNAPNGSIDVQVTGGTPDYDFEWEGPDGAEYDSEDLNGLTDGAYTLTVTDGNDCEATEVVTLTTVGLTEVVGDLGMTLMPNPTNGQLILELTRLVEKAVIEVFDGAGRRVFRQEGMTLSGQVQMDFSALSDGVYQIRLTAGQASAVQQLMVRH